MDWGDLAEEAKALEQAQFAIEARVAQIGPHPTFEEIQRLSADIAEHGTRLRRFIEVLIRLRQ